MEHNPRFICSAEGLTIGEVKDLVSHLTSPIFVEETAGGDGWWVLGELVADITGDDKPCYCPGLPLPHQMW